MTAPGRLPISLLTIILLLVPGAIALEIYARRAGKRFEVSRIQRIVYSVLLSVASLFVLYLSSPIYFDHLIEDSGNIAQGFGFAPDEEISSLRISAMVPLYVSHMIVAVGIALVLGLVDNTYLNPNKLLDRRPPWHYAFDETATEQVEVALTSGKVIRGQFNEAAWSKSDYELYIEDPEEIEYDNGEVAREPIDLGRSVLLSESAISYVIFVEEDPDKRPEPDFTFTVKEIEEIRGSLDEALRGVGKQTSLLDFESGGKEFSKKSKDKDD